MQYRSLESSLLEKPEAVKEFPFGPETAVFKVAGKMFALTSW
jgi:predicted DNA-binding protein (MmcQ/YjbR family)